MKQEFYFFKWRKGIFIEKIKNKINFWFYISIGNFLFLIFLLYKFFKIFFLFLFFLKVKTFLNKIILFY
jgi:hypothetical protein